MTGFVSSESLIASATDFIQRARVFAESELPALLDTSHAPKNAVEMRAIRSQIAAYATAGQAIIDDSTNFSALSSNLQTDVTNVVGEWTTALGQIDAIASADNIWSALDSGTKDTLTQSVPVGFGESSELAALQDRVKLNLIGS